MASGSVILWAYQGWCTADLQELDRSLGTDYTKG